MLTLAVVQWMLIGYQTCCFTLKYTMMSIKVLINQEAANENDSSDSPHVYESEICP